MLYKIGDFSKKCGVSVKTLRYYDEINLFKPVDIDIFTGYRYYNESQLEDIKLILKLKNASFSLEEIKNNWNNFNNDILLNKEKELYKEIDDIQNKIREINYLRSNIFNGKIILDNKGLNNIKIKTYRNGE